MSTYILVYEPDRTPRRHLSPWECNGLHKFGLVHITDRHDIRTCHRGSGAHSGPLVLRECVPTYTSALNVLAYVRDLRVSGIHFGPSLADAQPIETRQCGAWELERTVRRTITYAEHDPGAVLCDNGVTSLCAAVGISSRRVALSPPLLHLLRLPAALSGLTPTPTAHLRDPSVAGAAY